MSNLFFSKFDMIFTVNDNIKCLDDKNDNFFKLRNNKIYFENNFINKNIDTTVVGLYKNNFKIVCEDSDLLFGIENTDKEIIVDGDYFVNNQVIDGEMIKLYKGSIQIQIENIIKKRFFYVVDSNNTIYKIPFVYNELCKEQLCNNIKYQTYNKKILGKEIDLPLMSNLSNNINCSYSKVYRIRKLNKQQNLYTMMRLYPERFPIISSVKNKNLTLAQQRAYSNLWWKQFGTSQSLPVNNNWGGFYLVGSDVPYTN